MLISNQGGIMYLRIMAQLKNLHNVNFKLKNFNKKSKKKHGKSKIRRVYFNHNLISKISNFQFFPPLKTKKTQKNGTEKLSRTRRIEGTLSEITFKTKKN